MVVGSHLLFHIYIMS
uniref:Uncharacterized protein n=1 Tax=Arundo donax TaxID=35708 RepID=A0A0A8Z9X0_ARUDO